jgi:acetyl/propionyl-CoA carboxylase alpha subunit
VCGGGGGGSGGLVVVVVAAAVNTALVRSCHLETLQVFGKDPEYMDKYFVT